MLLAWCVGLAECRVLSAAVSVYLKANDCEAVSELISWRMQRFSVLL